MIALRSFEQEQCPSLDLHWIMETLEEKEGDYSISSLFFDVGVGQGGCEALRI